MQLKRVSLFGPPCVWPSCKLQHSSYLSVCPVKQQEIRASAHETCDSISLISYASCLYWFRHSSLLKRVSQPKIAKKFTKTYFGVQGRLRLRFFRGHTHLMPSFKGNLLTGRHEISSQETRGSAQSYGENPESLSHLGLNHYRVVPERQTDGICCQETRLYAIIYWKPNVIISHRLGSVPGRDTRTDGRTGRQGRI